MQKTMKNDFYKWMDGILSQEFPEETIAVCLNLYEDGNDQWSVELIGTDEFDEEDDDWACDEVIAFRDEPFTFTYSGDWEEVQEMVKEWVEEYLENGRQAEELLGYHGVAVGFVDGELEIVYENTER